MKSVQCFLCMMLVSAGPAFATVTISSPANHSTVASPVQFSATASSSCAQGVASMGIYVDNQRLVVQNGASLKASLNLSSGTHTTVVQEWDRCGGSTVAKEIITVSGTPSNATTVQISASPNSITSGTSAVLKVSAINATQVSIAGSNNTSYTLAAIGGSVTVNPPSTTTYTATASGPGGKATSTATVTVSSLTALNVGITANPITVAIGGSSSLIVTETNATAIALTDSNGNTYIVSPSGGTVTVTPTATTTYTAKATASTGITASSTVTVTVSASAGSDPINHVIFMLQENHSFDNYFGMLNPYRHANQMDVGADGLTYAVDGIDDKLSKITNDSDEGDIYAPFKFRSTCIDDLTSAWLESYGDVNRYDFSATRKAAMDGFVHTAEGMAKNCSQANSGCSGSFTDLTGKRAMGYYDQQFLNYDYYMASQFAVSDRWFSPTSSKSVPNRIATFTGGTTQGLVGDPGSDDHLPQLSIATIFSELDQSNVSWKIYYTTTQGGCLAGGACSGSAYPDTVFDFFTYAHRYMYKPVSGASCVAPTARSGAVGDTSNAFCIDPNHIAPLTTYYSDLANRTLPSFAFIEAGSGHNDEHPGSGQSILNGQSQVANVVNAFMKSPSWSDSAFFLSYDEGGGPYDHVPPVAHHSNQNTDPTVGSTSVQNIPDISSIAVNPDSYGPCLAPGEVPSLHCDLRGTNEPGAHRTDAVAQQGFAAQLGFRVPNMVISPFTRKHYVSHIPMDHTAVLKFVENRFIGPPAHLTARDQAQPNLLDFFDFTGAPWALPPTPPAPVTPQSLGYDPCTPQTF